MAFSASVSTTEPRSWSVGPVKYALYTYSVASGDTSGTITARVMQDRILHVIVDGGLQLTAAPTFSGNVATLAFNDPLATQYGTVLVVGV